MSKPVKKYKVVTKTNNVMEIAATSQLRARNLWNARYGKMMGEADSVTEVKPKKREKKYGIGFNAGVR